jgi:hypothetical protein
MNILGVESKVYSDCGYCKGKKMEEELIVPWKIYSEWLFMNQHMGNKEWGAVFNVVDGKITDYKIPPQYVTGTECAFREELGGNGMIHSHHTMSASFSGQDDKQQRNVYTWSLILTATGYVACKKAQLPCGGFSYVDVKLKIEDLPFDLKEIGELIQEKPVTIGYQGGNHGHWPPPGSQVYTPPAHRRTYSDPLFEGNDYGDFLEEAYDRDKRLLDEAIAEDVEGEAYWSEVLNGERLPNECLDCHSHYCRTCKKIPEDVKCILEYQGFID